MEYKVELYKSVNGLGFGTDKAEVRKIMGNFDNTTERDMFSDLFAEYEDDKLVSIEVFGDFIVEVNGVVFSSDDEFEEMERKIRQIDPDAEIDDCGAISKKYSIAAYFENGFDAFLIAKEGYYE